MVRLLAAAGVAGAALAWQTAGPAPIVPRGDVLASTVDGHLVILGSTGQVEQRISRWRPPAGWTLEGLALAHDRRHAYLSMTRRDRVRLDDVDLGDGSTRYVAPGLSPSVAPNGRLLYLVAQSVTGRIRAVDAAGRRIPFHIAPPIGTPPDLVTNWAPDGRTAAVYDGRYVRFVETERARSVWRQPSSRADHIAPAFLDGRHVVELANCCIGTHQRLVVFDRDTGRSTPFATIPAPVVSIRRLTPRKLLVVDQLGDLLVVSRGHARRLATNWAAADS